MVASTAPDRRHCLADDPEVPEPRRPQKSKPKRAQPEPGRVRGVHRDNLNNRWRVVIRGRVLGTHVDYNAAVELLRRLQADDA